MLSWFKVLSICSMSYSASAMPGAGQTRAYLWQVIENKAKKVSAVSLSRSCQRFVIGGCLATGRQESVGPRAALGRITPRFAQSPFLRGAAVQSLGHPVNVQWSRAPRARVMRFVSGRTSVSSDVSSATSHTDSVTNNRT
jgi:hypothetical protein